MKTADHILSFEKPSAKVLQLTDMQIIDSSQQRFKGRLTDYETKFWTRDKLDERCFDEMKSVIYKTKPDMILITGDLVYDEFDDSGEIWDVFVDFMESFGIPWAPVFGNHDKGSKIGMEYKINSLIEAENCLFCNGDTVGNGNYTIAFESGDRAFRLFYLLDSGQTGLVDEQLEWMNKKAEHFKEQCGFLPKSSACFHIPTFDFKQAARKYTDMAEERGTPFCFRINCDMPGEPTDFGTQNEKMKSAATRPVFSEGNFIDLLKKINADSVFAGHSHLVNTSICYEGIRWTMGLKTGEYDRFPAGKTGGTVIDVSENEIRVAHISGKEALYELV